MIFNHMKFMYFNVRSPLTDMLATLSLNIVTAMLLHLTFRYHLVGMLDISFDVRDSGSSNCLDLHLNRYCSWLTSLLISL